MDKGNNVVKAGGWLKGWVEGGSGGKMGDICNNVNNKNKLK